MLVSTFQDDTLNLLLLESQGEARVLEHWLISWSPAGGPPSSLHIFAHLRAIFGQRLLKAGVNLYLALENRSTTGLICPNKLQHSIVLSSRAYRFQ
jgi:hypothetical protein